MTTTSTAPVRTAQFPTDFVWGAATAAYQIEGGHDEDGRSPSIWDTFSALPGAVLHGDTGEVACDHYHRFRDDVALMKSLNLKSYRFSASWPRVRPDAGPVNQKGIDFYSRLTDELLAADILPWITLYHWDLPQTLEDLGGWTNRDTAYRFLDYALSMYDALGDRIPVWTTLNEPWCAAFLGYTGGQHAPGRQEGVAGVVAAHHLMLAHGLAVQELRRRGATPEAGKSLGITLNLTVADPFDASEPKDVEAARRVDGFFNRVFLEPIFNGRYAADLAGDTEGMRFEGKRWQEFVLEGDLALINQPIDALGVNYYHGDAPSGRPHHRPEELLGTRIENPTRPTSPPWPGGEDLSFPRRGLDVTDMDWEIQPEGLTRLLIRLRNDYPVPPLYITENGAAYDDVVEADGTVNDQGRLDYIRDHLLAAHEAIEAEVDVRGYFAWSLLDNFEWAYGYAKRFGIVHVDYETQLRTPKASAHWYADVAATGRV